MPGGKQQFCSRGRATISRIIQVASYRHQSPRPRRFKNADRIYCRRTAVLRCLLCLL